MNLLYRSIDQFNHTIGKLVSWFILVMVLIQFWLVLTRYLFSINSLYNQELIVYLHGFSIMLGAAFTWLYDGHVRVDIFFRKLPEKTKYLTETIGAIIFTIPFMLLMIWAAWPDVVASWLRGEGSGESSGIPYKYILKASLIAFSSLMIIQALSHIIKNIMLLQGKSVYDPYRNEAGADD